MAILIATMIAGSICFWIGYHAGIKEGKQRMRKLKIEYDAFSKRYDEVMKFITNLIEEEMERGGQNASK